MTRSFTVECDDAKSSARAGLLRTAHGVVETPVFMPVGTQGTVKCMSPDELRELGAQIILGNTYHLIIRPGLEMIAKAGGLHKFMNWDGPILTDSGGFQVFSLAKLRKIPTNGVEFQSHVDGATLFLGPREAMAAQAHSGQRYCDGVRRMSAVAVRPRIRLQKRGADTTVGGSLPGTREARRTIALWNRAGKRVSRICGNGARANWSRWSSTATPSAASAWANRQPEMLRQVEMSAPLLPADKPRYVMGVGTPPQMLEMIARGVDMFDCVLPTRVARNGTVFTATRHVRDQERAVPRGLRAAGGRVRVLCVPEFHAGVRAAPVLGERDSWDCG